MAREGDRIINLLLRRVKYLVIVLEGSSIGYYKIIVIAILFVGLLDCYTKPSIILPMARASKHNHTQFSGASE